MASGPTDEQRLHWGAAFLGWVLPGLGQVVLGERRRGFLAMAGVLFLFLSGLFVGGIDSVDRKEDRLWFAGQMCAGPIAFAADFANTALIKSGKFGVLVPSPQPPGSPPGARPLKVSTFKGLAHANEFGTLFCFLAGLMNLVVVMDALVRVPHQQTYGRRKDDPIESARAARGLR